MDKTKDKRTGFIAIDKLIHKLGREIQQFTTECFATPKGILFWGPPGTGKSAISLKICELLGVIFAAKPMVSNFYILLFLLKGRW